MPDELDGTKRIVGYSISDRVRARLAVNALNNAASRRRGRGQCRDGILLRAPSEERPRPPLVVHSGGAADRVIIWIERPCHRRSRQARLGRLTPVEYETIMNPTVSLAA